MKAAVRKAYGGPESINIVEIEKPILNDNQVLIKVLATTVNRTDCANLTAKPFIMRFILGLIKPKKIVLGTDFAGEIIAVGKDVDSFKINDKVFGFTDTGLETQAEYISIIPKGNISLMPHNVGFKQAAAALEGAHYAYSFIHKVELKKGQKVLVNGATGGIGSALIQFVKQFDVEVAATCNTKNIDLIKTLGADRIYDYTSEDFTKSDDKYDYIFDAVGKSTFGKCKPLLNENGIYISSELGPYSQNLFFSISTSLRKGKRVIFPIPFSVQKTIPYIYNMLEQGKFKPVIDKEYSLENISLAYEFVMTGEKTGNVIVNI